MGGKATAKKDLGLLAMTYGTIYVARVALGARDTQTLQALREAESFPGPSLIIAYAHCIAHGISMSEGMDHQKLAVETGYWPLYRFDPRRAARGESPLVLDSPAPKLDLVSYTRLENRFRVLEKQDPERAHEFERQAQAAVTRRFALYQKLAVAFAADGPPPAGDGSPLKPKPTPPPSAGNGSKPGTHETGHGLKSITSG